MTMLKLRGISLIEKVYEIPFIQKAFQGIFKSARNPGKRLHVEIPRTSQRSKLPLISNSIQNSLKTKEFHIIKLRLERPGARCGFWDVAFGFAKNLSQQKAPLN